jgi:hypothetical protein
MRHLASLTFASFLDENKIDLEKETKCQISLRVVQGQYNMTAVKMSLEVEGSREAIDLAIESIEDRLLDCLPNQGEKKLLMHAIAVDNPCYYRHTQGLVYQREPVGNIAKNKYPRKWMCVEELPEDAWLRVLDEKLIKGPTRCLVWIIRQTGRKKSFIYICGHSLFDVKSSRDRACDQIRLCLDVRPRLRSNP